MRTYQTKRRRDFKCGRKKKELIGNFKAKGSEWRRSKNPREVEMHDFPLAASEKLIPYGIYDIQNNEAYITLNTSHETAELIYSVFHNCKQ